MTDSVRKKSSNFVIFSQILQVSSHFFKLNMHQLLIVVFIALFPFVPGSDAFRIAGDYGMKFEKNLSKREVRNHG